MVRQRRTKGVNRLSRERERASLQLNNETVAHYQAPAAPLDALLLLRYLVSLPESILVYTYGRQR